MCVMCVCVCVWCVCVSCVLQLFLWHQHSLQISHWYQINKRCATDILTLRLMSVGHMIILHTTWPPSYLQHTDTHTPLFTSSTKKNNGIQGRHKRSNLLLISVVITLSSCVRGWICFFEILNKCQAIMLRLIARSPKAVCVSDTS